LPGDSTITNEFDGLGRLLSTVLKDALGGTLNSHAYEYNDGHQRTKQTFAPGNYVDYTYDDLGQLQTARGWESDASTPRQHEQFGYAYDKGWNLNRRTNNALVQTFTVNPLNELTNVMRANTYTVAGNVSTTPTSVTVKDNANPAVAAAVYGDNSFAREDVPLLNGNNTFIAIAENAAGLKDTNIITAYLPTPVTLYYDSRGNLTNDGRRVLYYDDENQLTSVTVSNGWRSEFAYDGLMRRRIRREYTWASGWVQTNEVRYVYDGLLVIQERDTNNAPLVTYTRGNDLSGTRQGAGGIGGLLARTAHSALSTYHSSAFYHSDGNGNVTALVNSNQIVVARYSYDPFGGLLASSGPLAEANTHRFSSKECHANTGLYYYGYRFYEPHLQRWLNHDPIGEYGGLNLYAFVANYPMGFVDMFGLDPRPTCNTFWPAYPRYGPNGTSQADVWKKIGGNVGKAYGPDSNSCAARMSCGLNNGGAPIPRGTPGASRNFSDQKYEGKAGDDKYYIVSAQMMREHLKDKWGNPDKVAKTPQDLKDIVNGLKPGECAVFATTGHVGVLKPGYQDPYVDGLLPVDVWVLPAPPQPPTQPPRGGTPQR
jgi:RHS repeat-associated protein